ncbi:hypothetical protein BGX29_009862 [Mortierella sp. GBA35]|nr:hypothetical protein BGX29_009862 [Mortierella sp. GBA35]
MLRDIDVAYQWPRFLVSVFSIAGIASGIDKFLLYGIYEVIRSLSFDLTDDTFSIVFGSIQIITNLVSLLAAFSGSLRFAALSVYLLIIHLVGSPALWSFLVRPNPWNWAGWLGLLFIFTRTWATIVMWRDSRGLTRKYWGGLVTEEGVFDSIVRPAPIQLP